MWVALETREKATGLFFPPQKRQIQSNGILIYRDIYIIYRSTYMYTYIPPSTPGLLATHNGKAKMENLKKKVDSISMIQPAICYSIQGDSFSHTLA